MRALSKDKKLVEERRRQIADGAVRLFIKQGGFHKATVRQIADSCKMSVGNLYNYVKSKEDVLFLAMDYVMHAADKVARTKYDPSDPAGALRKAITYSYSDLDKLQDYVLFAYQETKNLPARHRNRILQTAREVALLFERLLVDGMLKGVFRSDIDPVLISQNIIVLGHMWCFRRWSLRNDYTFQKYVERQLDFLFAAISTHVPEDQVPTARKTDNAT